jgi:hypothetical protein
MDIGDSNISTFFFFFGENDTIQILTIITIKQM